MYLATLRRLSLLVMTCVLTVFGIAASGAVPAPTATATEKADGPRVIVPGRPGEQAKVVSPDQVKLPDGQAYSATDVWFVRMMIPHHSQAIAMASLAAGRAHNPQIVGIAERIKAAQLPEILQLRAWLQQHKLDEDDKQANHDHSSMPGMQSAEAMRGLAEARGEQFDRMFVAMMSAHHQGAIDMAALRLRANGDVMVERMAEAIGYEQGVEIARMRDILA
jgi:uncharacterized protein (DUF305 family)